MKVDVSSRFLTCLAVLSLLGWSFVASSAFGSLIVRDEFNYPNGALDGNMPSIGGVWTNHSGTLNQMQVVSGQAQVDHSLSEDSHTDFSGGPIGAGTTIYGAFDLTVPSQASDPGTVYFAHFSNGGTFFTSRVFITAPATTGDGYRLGVSGNTTLIASETWPTDLAFDTTYRVVHSYNYDTGAIQMWIDPVNESSPSVSATDGIAGDAEQNYSLRESSSNSKQLIDCLQVATTFDEANNCVPEPVSALLLMVGGLGLACVRRAAALTTRPSLHSQIATLCTAALRHERGGFSLIAVDVTRLCRVYFIL